MNFYTCDCDTPSVQVVFTKESGFEEFDNAVSPGMFKQYVELFDTIPVFIYSNCETPLIKKLDTSAKLTMQVYSGLRINDSEVAWIFNNIDNELKFDSKCDMRAREECTTDFSVRPCRQ